MAALVSSAFVVGAISARRRGGGGGGGSGGATAPFLLGIIPPASDYSKLTTTTPDLAQGNFWEYVDGSGNHELPGANMDANRRPTSLPAGATALRRVILPAPSVKPFAGSWTGGAVTAVTCPADPSSISNVNLSAKTFTYTPSHIQPDVTAVGIHFACPVGSPPSSFTLLPADDTGVVANLHSQHISDWTVPLGPIRTVKEVGVENNSNVSAAFAVANIDQGGALTAEWFPNDGSSNGGRPNDGVPMTFIAARANAKNRSVWDNLHNNLTDAQIDARAAYFRDTLNSNLSYMPEGGDEDWNGGYAKRFAQLTAEAASEVLPAIDGSNFTVTGSVNGDVLTITAGGTGTIQHNDSVAGNGIAGRCYILSTHTEDPTMTGTGGTGTYRLNASQGTLPSGTFTVKAGGALERSVEHAIHVMGRIGTVWAQPRTGGGTKATLQRMYAMQNDNPTIAANLLNYTTTNAGGVKLYQNIEMMASALYARPDETVDQSQNPFTAFTVAQIIAQMKVNFLNQIASAKIITAAAAAKGLIYGVYEFGTETFFADDAFHAALYNDAGMRSLYMWMLQQLELNFPSNTPVCTFVETNPVNHFGPPGLVNYAAQSPYSQKGLAQKDFVSGVRQLQTLSGSLACPAGSAAGAVLGTLSGRIKGSTVTLQSNPGGAAAITDATANVIQLTVASAASFAAAGTVNITVRETDPRDPTGFKDTVIAISVVGGTQWDAANKAASINLTNSNLTATWSGTAADGQVLCSKAKPAGYAELVVTTTGGAMMVGVQDGTQALNDFPGDTNNSIGWKTDGSVIGNNGALLATWAAYATNDRLGICWKGGKFYGRKNGAWQGGADPVAGTGGIAPSGGATSMFITADIARNGNSVTGNFGASAFVDSAPSGLDWE